MLSVILAVVSVPRYLYADDLVFSRNDGCLVDSTLNYQRFYYCGNQSFGCARETHDNSDYSVCNDGSEVQKKNGACFLTDGTKFTTRSGDTFYCCNGTSTSMGKMTGWYLWTPQNGAVNSRCWSRRGSGASPTAMWWT